MKRRNTIINSIVCVLVAAIIITAGVLVGYFYGTINTWFNKGGMVFDTPELAEEEEKSLEFTKTVTEEGIVLLRNENDTLPLETSSTNKKNVNLFGWATTDLISGGSGGSGGNSISMYTIPEAIEAADFEVNDDLLNMYTSYQSESRQHGDGEANPDEGKIGVLDDELYKGNGDYSPTWQLPEPDINDSTWYTSDLLSGAKSFSDTAILTLGRTGGEGMDDPIGYLSLTQREKDLANYLVDNYTNVIVVLNTANMIEIGYLETCGTEGTGVGAILLMPGTGNNGVLSLGEILNGTVNPSGRLVDTVAYDHETAPSYWYANRMGTMTYADAVAGKGSYSNYHYVDYVEGIYVGYKWYETADAEGFWESEFAINRWDSITGEGGYDQVVQYPFGYGLSYTTFDEEITRVSGSLSSDTIDLRVKVTNTGKVAGKDVLEVYAEAPYTEQNEADGVEKASVDLVAFEKTDLLEPGESETYEIEVDTTEIASYNSTRVHDGLKGCYVLDAGDYKLKLMDNAHDVVDVAEMSLNKEILITTDSNSGNEIFDHFEDVEGGDETEDIEYITRADFVESYPKRRSRNGEADGFNYGRKMNSETQAKAESLSYEEIEGAEPITTGADNGLTLDDMTYLDYDDPLWDDLLDQMTLDEITSLVTSTGLYKYAAIPSVGLDFDIVFSEGPQGISSWTTGDAATNFPVEMFMALTWNKDIANEWGQHFGSEAKLSGTSGLCAPAVNIHRTPYCGRNFEYMSEDGYLTGMMAGNEVYGARQMGVICIVKHFALNDQESNRGEFYTSLFTWSTEQAMREVFVKQFELCVKEGHSLAFMTTFSRVGSTWTGASKALQTDLLRDEWGFNGFTLTDLYVPFGNEWWMDSVQMIHAGQSMYLTLGFGIPSFSSDELEDASTQNALRNAAHNILYAMSQSDIVPANLSRTWIVWTTIGLSVLGAADIVYAVFIAYKSLKKKDDGADSEETDSKAED